MVVGISALKSARALSIASPASRSLSWYGAGVAGAGLSSLARLSPSSWARSTRRSSDRFRAVSNAWAGLYSLLGSNSILDGSTGCGAGVVLGFLLAVFAFPLPWVPSDWAGFLLALVWRSDSPAISPVKRWPPSSGLISSTLPCFSLATISCWLAPAAIKFAATVIACEVVRSLLKRSVAATTPVSSALATCWLMARSSLRSSTSSVTSSQTLLAPVFAQSGAPSWLGFRPMVATTESCKIWLCAATALSSAALLLAPRASTISTL